MFLATMEENAVKGNHGNENDNNYISVVAVGAAELSPIELQGVFEEEEDDVTLVMITSNQCILLTMSPRQ